MSSNEKYILYGEKEEYYVQYESLGKYLFDCLKNRNFDDVLALDGETQERLTCGELLEKSIKLAIALNKMSINKGDVAAIVSENSVDYYPPLLALLYLGVIINPVNPAYTPGEFKHTFKYSKPKIVFCSSTALRNLLAVEEECDYFEYIILLKPSMKVKSNIKILNELVDDVTANLSKLEVQSVNLSDIVVLVSSSGTTGLPKCVALTHANFIPTLSILMDPRFLNISGSITVSVLPFFHIYGLFIHISTICCPFKVILLPQLKSDRFIKLIREFNCTILFLVPVLFHYFLKNSHVTAETLATVKTITTGAAPLGKNIYEEMQKKFSHIKIIQLYGATETCGICVMQRETYMCDTLGSLIPNTTAKVVNPTTQENLGPLNNGELCFKGIQVMKEYYNNLSETNSLFDSDGFYHTGDIGYYNEDGIFFYVDRMKEIIKYKGFQVAPAELENLLLTHDKIKECGVIGIPNETCGELPFAYVVPKDGVNITVDEIINFVSENISIQKHLRGGVRFIQEIPRTPSGKICRYMLQKLYKDSK